MRLYIAEKPSLARAIAEGLGGQHKKNGCIECANGNVVTWCFGHILEQLDPNEYDEKYVHWHLDDLPIIPERWKLKVKKDAATSTRSSKTSSANAMKSSMPAIQTAKASSSLMRCSSMSAIRNP